MAAITAIICAHNEASVLPAALESLVRQTLEPGGYEVIVVDSASSDETSRVAEAWRHGALAGRLRVVRLEDPGLSLARNAGMEAAHTSLVAFLDADAVASPEWLGAIADQFATDRLIGCVGGPVEVQWDHPKPAWWSDALDEVFNAWRPAGEAQALTYPRYPYGTNIAFRLEAVRKLGGFRTGLGRVGRRLAAGEEGELCYRMEAAGLEIRYEPRAVVRHRTKAIRLSRRFILQRAWHHGRSQAKVEQMHGFRSGLYPSWLKIVGHVACRTILFRLDFPFLKYVTFRAGYRWQFTFASRVHAVEAAAYDGHSDNSAG